jgi:O-antigen ligase
MASRAASTTDLSEGSIADRLDLWLVGVEIAIDHPLLGTGPETYTELFPQYRNRMPAGRQTFWMAYSPESPHNVYLAIADGEGLPALVAYLTLVGAVLWQLARECTRAPSRATRALLAAVLAAAVGHLVADMFMTADVAGSWLIWLLLGAAVGYAERIGLDRASGPVPGRRRQLATLARSDWSCARSKPGSKADFLAAGGRIAYASSTQSSHQAQDPN